MTDQNAALTAAARRLRAAAEAITEAEKAISKVPSKAVREPFERPFTASEHIRLHRPGRPAKLDTDHELRTFVLARIETMTFHELERAVADAFPEDRRVRKTALNDWWIKRHRYERP